ncbi:hypothetical protein Ahy_B03g063009 isoform C [Arachis hypogaea]|uniref:DRBM domain-containing protein n=1 Tax=Arachis hypogaea TaxID=3818 RepID=A0A444ZW45_ARAHY|nr:hypothetical protein Ahy_B03g063009 isoform C [Arachis hypogaea]
MELPTQIQLPEHMADSSSSPQPPPQPPTSSSLVQHVSPSSSPLPQHLRYKNRLQEFAQRSNMPLPGYQTTNEGTPHAPKFRATVWVDGISYTSQMTFSQRKAAEQDAARLALESLNEKIRDDRCPLVFENTLISKSIMNEYATKLNVDRPTYNTVKLEGLLPRFMSFVIFNGTKYTSVIGKNKKEAEQLAARAAILSVLGDSSSTTLYEIIRSKSSFYGIAKSNESQVTNGSIVLPIGTTGYDFDLQHHNVLPVATTEYASGLQDHKDKEVPMATNNGEKRIDVVPASSNMLSSSQELQMPIHVPCVEGPFPPKSSSLQPVGSELGQLAASDSSNSGSKRRKNKKKANKKARLESMVPSAADPCSLLAPTWRRLLHHRLNRCGRHNIHLPLPPPLLLLLLCLQDLAKKLNIVLPEYETIRDRSSEVPMYRSTVLVDGMSFTSEITLSTRKAAEQDIARVAFENLSKKVKDHGCALVCENTAFAKSALDEYAAKLNTRPTYNTVKLEGGANAATLYGMIKSLSRIYAACEENNIQCVVTGLYHPQQL